MTLLEKMEVERKYANQCRRRYLMDKLLEMQKLRDECMASDDDIDQYTAVDMIVAIGKVRKQLDALNKTYKEGDITDEMVEQARSVDTASVIDFVGGKSLAFCHDDRSPSLMYHRKTGRATCFVCNKTYDAIGVLMERDGYNFPSAVRYLCNQ